MKLLYAFLFLGVLLTNANAQASAADDQVKVIEWAFPKPDMPQKVIGDYLHYDLGNEFYGRFDVLNGQKIAIVVLRPGLGKLVDNVNREKPGDIPDRDQFMSAIAVEKAIPAPRGEVHKYLGEGKLSGRRVYLFQTHNEAIVGAMLSDDRSFVILLPHEGSKKPTTPTAKPTPKPTKTCLVGGTEIPC